MDSTGKIREDIPSLCVKYSGAAAQSTSNLQHIAYEVCDTVIANAKDRFDFTGHLSAAILFNNTRFCEFSKDFPTETLKKAVDALHAIC